MILGTTAVTREHLGLLAALNIPFFVVITKKDLVDKTQLELYELFYNLWILFFQFEFSGSMRTLGSCSPEPAWRCRPKRSRTSVMLSSEIFFILKIWSLPYSKIICERSLRTKVIYYSRNIIIQQQLANCFNIAKF